MTFSDLIYSHTHTPAFYFEASSGWGQVISSWLFCGGRSQVISSRSCITDHIEKWERQVQGLCHWRSPCLFCVGVTVGIALMVAVSKSVVPVKTSSLNSFCVCHSVRVCMCVKRNCFLIVLIKYPSLYEWDENNFHFISQVISCWINTELLGRDGTTSAVTFPRKSHPNFWWKKHTCKWDCTVIKKKNKKNHEQNKMTVI